MWEMSQESLEHEGSYILSCPSPLKPRASIGKASALSIKAFKLFPIINTFTHINYTVNGNHHHPGHHPPSEEAVAKCS